MTLLLPGVPNVGFRKNNGSTWLYESNGFFRVKFILLMLSNFFENSTNCMLKSVQFNINLTNLWRHCRTDLENILHKTSNIVAAITQLIPISLNRALNKGSQNWNVRGDSSCNSCLFIISKMQSTKKLLKIAV